jgi:hypothetical protein
MKPQFWTGSVKKDGSDVPLTEVGLWVVGHFIHWVETLGPVELSAIAGITVLNEPAHMAHLDKLKGKVFTSSEQQVMDWVAQAASLFRQSSLPGKGVRLYVSMIESAFKYFWDTVPVWWNQTFTENERNSWAVFDLHFYDAWTPPCSGRTVPGGAYRCDQPLAEIKPIIRRCGEDYMFLYAAKIIGLRACGEFSVATFKDSELACHEGLLLDMYMRERVEVFQRFGVEAFFWSWRMPHGHNYQSSWSLKHLAGLEE